MNLYENILKRLLTELRDAPILGEMPAGSVYYAMLYPKGNVVYLAAGSNGMPVSRAADSLNPLHVFRAVNGKPLVQVQKDPERMKIVQKMLDASLLTIEEKELSSWDVKPNQPRNFRGKNPELFQDPDNIPKTAGYIKSTLGYSSPVNAIKIDKDKKQIDLDASHAEWMTRRPGKNRDGKSYVIPSGDVAFGEKTLPLQKMFKHILGRDSGVDETFKIVGSEKFRGQTVADVISAPREYDAALTGQAGPITMYHGTSVKRWKEIQKKGLVPGKYDEAYADLIPGYSENNVYLTVSPAEAENYATRQAIKDKSKAMVLKVTVPDYTRFKPDEDQMGRVKLSRPYSLEVKRPTMGNMPVDLEEVHPRNFFYALRIDHYVPSEELEALKKEVESKISNELVSKSLKGGDIAYKGRIPPGFIKPFMEYKRQAFKTPERKGGPSDEEYQTIRKDVQQKAKRFDEARLRRMLRNILRENFKS
jgi:hypothetical protein